MKRQHLETDERLLPCLAVYMIVAWRVLFALMLGRGCPDASCEIVFDPKEWKAAYIVVKRCPPPSVPPRLGEVIALVTSLGGYLGRKHDGPPALRPCGSVCSVCEKLSLPLMPYNLLVKDVYNDESWSVGTS